MVDTIAIRRDFHQYPETGFSEFITTLKILKYLNEDGIEILYGKKLYGNYVPNYKTEEADYFYDRALKLFGENKTLDELKGGYTGVIAKIGQNNSLPTIAIRVDIDGLKVKESTDNRHFPNIESFSSTNEFMHACGHDAHIAIGISLAKIFNKFKFEKNLIVIFQPGEEGYNGGKIFSQFPIIKSIDKLIALHIGVIEENKIVCGLNFMANKRYRIEIMGKSSHASNSPHAGIDAIRAFASMVNLFHSLPNHANGIFRVELGKVSSENPPNIICEKLKFILQIRGQTQELLDYVDENIAKFISGVDLAFGTQTTKAVEKEVITATNSDSLIEKIYGIILKNSFGHVEKSKFVLGSDDAAYLIDSVIKNSGEATYMCFGCLTHGGHHTPTFDIDENSMNLAVNTLKEIILEL